ncbi:hypothetical protein Pmani_038826 [Petrolisthes manimaculis]|uniref:Uncharacterized protein n=1 Tax=Petrolisthes manimaculis TaxID=1843537 RepID=A0AAE1NEW7_9EUCA|nr:hypothetical protein Pmani_038826 [Petrolisthes manimaculis]
MGRMEPRRSFASEWQAKAEDCDRRAAARAELVQEQYNQHARPLPRLRVGDTVRIQNLTSLRWDKVGVVMSCGRSRDYEVRLPSGRVYWRNRRFLRPINPPGVDPLPHIPEPPVSCTDPVTESFIAPTTPRPTRSQQGKNIHGAVSRITGRDGSNGAKTGGLTKAALTRPCTSACSFASEWQAKAEDCDRRAAARAELVQEQYNQHARPLPRLRVGDTVRIQNLTSLRWDKVGVVMSCGRSRDYEVRLPSGRVYWRNRRFLRPINPPGVDPLPHIPEPPVSCTDPVTESFIAPTTPRPTRSQQGKNIHGAVSRITGRDGSNGAKTGGLTKAALTRPCTSACSFASEWQAKAEDCDRRAAARAELVQEQYNQHARPLPRLRVGDTVRIQNLTSLRWDKVGVVMSCGRSRDYEVRLPSGRVYWRNRRFLRPINPPGVDPLPHIPEPPVSCTDPVTESFIAPTTPRPTRSQQGKNIHGAVSRITGRDGSNGAKTGGLTKAALTRPCTSACSFASEWQAKAEDCDRRAAARAELVQEQYNQHARPLPRLRVGDTVRIQNLTSLRWDKVGVVMSCGRSRDYEVRLPSGRVYWRNRRFLRPINPPGVDPLPHIPEPPVSCTDPVTESFIAPTTPRRSERLQRTESAR